MVAWSRELLAKVMEDLGPLDATLETWTHHKFFCRICMKPVCIQITNTSVWWVAHARTPPALDSLRNGHLDRSHQRALEANEAEVNALLSINTAIYTARQSSEESIHNPRAHQEWTRALVLWMELVSIRVEACHNRRAAIACAEQRGKRQAYRDIEKYANLRAKHVRRQRDDRDQDS
jgi:hypothetical protein